MTIRPTSRFRWNASRFVGTVLATALLGACGGKQEFLLDSDVPIPADSAGRATSGIERRDGVLTGVDTVFVIEVDDPQARLDALATRFSASGWSNESRGSSASTASIVFANDDRRCRVRIVRNELDPAMSRIAYRVWTVDDEVTGPEPGSRKVDG